MSTESICVQCDHLLGPHVTVTLKKDPTYGGLILCPLAGCQCVTPWAPEGHQPPPLPDLGTLLGIWQTVQQPHLQQRRR